jgi:hypothetical protein
VDIQTLNKVVAIPSGPEGCLPPCWNGLTPGESSPFKMPLFFARFGRAFNDAMPSKARGDNNLLEVDFGFTTTKHKLYSIRIFWEDRIEAIDLYYTKWLDLYGETSFLHPKAMIENVGLPESAKLLFYTETSGTLILDVANKNTTIIYEVEVKITGGESRLCMMQPEDDPDIQVIFYAESFDPDYFVFEADEYEDQAIFTGLTLPDFLTELAIVGRCIPVQFPE